MAAIAILSALGGCATSGQSSVNPLESKLLALEGRSLQLHGDKLAAQQAAEQSRIASLNAVMPEPDLHETPDIISPTVATKNGRNGSPIGRVSN